MLMPIPNCELMRAIYYHVLSGEECLACTVYIVHVHVLSSEACAVYMYMYVILYMYMNMHHSKESCQFILLSGHSEDVLPF